MADRPILFSGPMVRALLAGRKTQTRRIAKITAIMGNRVSVHPPEELIELEPGEFRRGVMHYASTGALSGPYSTGFAVGDRLWVKETWASHWSTDDQKPSEIDGDLWSVRYFADDTLRPAARDGSVALLDQCSKKRVAIFMPRWASRLTLLVTDVRVEQLNNCSEVDALEEGAYRGKASGRVADSYAAMAFGDCFHTARGWYRDLWDRINGAGAWEANPWVIAVSFEVRLANIDAEVAEA